MGLGLGGLLVGLDLALRPWLAPLVVNALLVAALVALSGALHLDGLVDTCDAFCARGTPTERLALMHDSRAHDMGALAACLLLLGKFAALAALPDVARLPALLTAPLLARWAIVVAYWAYPYARRTPGASLALKAQATWRRAAWATGFVLVVLACVLGPAGPVLLVGAGLLVHGVALLVRTRLPGLTGDVYGAIAELVEACALILVPLALGGYR